MAKHHSLLTSRWGMRVSAIGFIGILATGSAQAASVYGTNVVHDFINDGPLTGSRSGSTQIVDTPDGAEWNGFTIAWNISFDDNTDLFTYKYTVTGLSNKTISHLTIDVSDDREEDDFSNPMFTIGIVSQTLDDDDFEVKTGPKEMDGIVGAMKFDEGGGNGIMYSVQTAYRPMWGDFFAKGGNSNIVHGTKLGATNTGFGDHTSMDTNDFIATPDTLMGPPSGGPGVVPLPAAAWMGMVMLGGLGAVKKFRSRRLA